jgi:hypothetical protein
MRSSPPKLPAKLGSRFSPKRRVIENDLVERRWALRVGAGVESSEKILRRCLDFST